MSIQFYKVTGAEMRGTDYEIRQEQKLEERSDGEAEHNLCNCDVGLTGVSCAGGVCVGWKLLKA